MHRPLEYASSYRSFSGEPMSDLDAGTLWPQRTIKGLKDAFQAL